MHAFRPGESAAAEGPFRTLRVHRWATSGVRVARRAAGRLRGQLTIFSSLNVESARLARHGKTEAAKRLARAAAALESGPEFTLLQQILSELPSVEAERVLEGVLPANAPPNLATSLKEIARLAEQMRGRELAVAGMPDVFAGRIAEVHEAYVVLIRITGQAAMIPRWMAAAAQREEVGDLLALVTDRLQSSSAVVDAVPAIDVNDVDVLKFSSFGRGDARVRRLNSADVRLLEGAPEALQIIVPVQIDV